MGHSYGAMVHSCEAVRVKLDNNAPAPVQHDV